jgi:dienelactone hydrolase
MSTGYCRDCVSGVINSGTPTGSETTVHGLPTYVARPEGQSKGLIVIIPDSFGWVFPNSRVLADKYAHDGGFTVYLPDFMGGKSSPKFSHRT